MTRASERARDRANPRSRVARMNEATSDYLEHVPLPARQQLGIFDELVDVDARSGNGIPDRVPMEDVPGADYQQPSPYTGGGGVLETRYHLESTPPPSEPPGAPGSDSYNNNVLATPGAEGSDTVRVPTAGGGGVAAYQREGEVVTTQREQPGRDERISEITGANNISQPAEPTNLPVVDTANATTDSGGSAPLQPAQDQPASENATATSQSSSATQTDAAPSDDASAAEQPAQDQDEVPEGSMQVILSWVGDDKDRARRALEAEQARPTPRQTLITQLNEKLA